MKLKYILFILIASSFQYACKKINNDWRFPKIKNETCLCQLKPILNSMDFEHHSSFALNQAYIKYDQLFVKGRFISTDKMYAPDYYLFIDKISKNSDVKIQFKAKLDKKYLYKLNDIYTDLRSFEHTYCFDLSSLKNQYKHLANQLEIELVLSDGQTQLLSYEL